MAAIYNSNGLFARNITTSGYSQAIINKGGHQADHDSSVVNEFVSHEVLSLFDSPLKSLNLAIKETPELEWDYATNPTAWVNVLNYGPPVQENITRCDGKTFNYTNWAPAFQRAIDDGAVNIYVPAGAGTLKMHGDIYVRGNVKRIYGNRKQVKGNGCGESELHVTWHVEDGSSPIVKIEKFDSPYANFHIEHNSSRTLVVQNMMSHQIDVKPGAGELFLEDVSIAHLNMSPGNKVWARQLNMEAYKQPRMALNDGGDLWILGLKTENDAKPILETRNGSSEILGGFIYANKNFDPDKIMFSNIESAFSATLGESTR